MPHEERNNIMDVKIATAPCSWGVWWADGTPSRTPWNVFLDQAHEAGYKALEMGPDGYLPTDVGQLKEELAKRDLEICAGTACYTFADYKDFPEIRPRVEQLCTRLRQFDAHWLVTMDDSPIGYDREIKKNITEEEWNRLYILFRDMGEYTENEFGIRTVFHQHNGTLIESEAETIRIMEQSGLDLCLDTGHFAAVNGSWQHGDKSAIEFMRRYADRIPYLHFKNVNGKVYREIIEKQMPIGKSRKLDIMCNLDEGTIDYEEFRDLLSELDFKGIGVIEQDVPNAITDEAFAIARHNLNYLRKIGLIG